MQSSGEKLVQELFPPVSATDAKKRPETAGSQFRVCPTIVMLLVQYANLCVDCHKCFDHHSSVLQPPLREVYQAQ